MRSAKQYPAWQYAVGAFFFLSFGITLVDLAARSFIGGGAAWLGGVYLFFALIVVYLGIRYLLRAIEAPGESPVASDIL